MEDSGNRELITRRKILQNGMRIVTGLALGGFTAVLIKKRAVADNTAWQLDPYICLQCGNCATECVLPHSAVKCVHAYAVCGYCKLCSGYFRPNSQVLDTSAEYQQCPVNAIKRTFVENPYFEYVIDESLCIGCGKCVAGCSAFGNGSLFLQVRHDRCLNCNSCAIARSCPSNAYKRVPASDPYILKGRARIT